MAKRKKEKTGRVITVSKDDNALLKRYFLDCENIGVTKSNSEICDDIFRKGLYTSIKEMDKIYER